MNFLLKSLLSDTSDGIATQNGNLTNGARPSLRNVTSNVDDPEVIFLRRRLFDDLTRTRTLDCDDEVEEDAISNISSYDTDSVALSVIVDQDFGLVGDTVPPNISPPPVPDLLNENIHNQKYNIDTWLDTWTNPSLANGNKCLLIKFN